MRGRPSCCSFKEREPWLFAEHLSDKLLAAKDVIGENAPARDRSLGKDAGCRVSE